MIRRRRFKGSASINDRLRVFADELRAKARELRHGSERNELLRRARQADTASHIDAWVSSPGLQPPK
jgi:hypothetical protein